MTPEHIGILIALIVGLGESYRQYRKTGRIRLVSLPWRAFKRGFYEIRRTLFSTSYPEEIRAPLATGLDTFTTKLAEQGYEPEWPLSYAYAGEDLNCRRYYYDPEADYTHRQIHVRAWENDSTIWVYAHDEPSPIHHPIAHLRSQNMRDVTDWIVDNWQSPDGLDPRKLK